MTRRVKVIVVLYIILGSSLAALSFIVFTLTNVGYVFQDNTLFRYAVLASSLIIMLIGAHIVVAGIASLRSSGR